MNHSYFTIALAIALIIAISWAFLSSIKADSFAQELEIAYGYIRSRDEEITNLRTAHARKIDRVLYSVVRANMLPPFPPNAVACLTLTLDPRLSQAVAEQTGMTDAHRQELIQVIAESLARQLLTPKQASCVVVKSALTG